MLVAVDWILVGLYLGQDGVERLRQLLLLLTVLASLTACPDTKPSAFRYMSVGSYRTSSCLFRLTGAVLVIAAVGGICGSGLRKDVLPDKVRATGRSAGEFGEREPDPVNHAKAHGQ